MAFVPEADTWEAGIYQFEETDVLQGGPAGIDNVPSKQLANRTLYLKNLVEALGTGKQPLDATLTALAALVTAADKLIYATGADTFSTATLTAFARTLLADADASAARSTIGAISQAQLDSAIAALIDTSPAALNTLNELAAALGDDPNFAATVNTAIALRLTIADFQKSAAITAAAGGAADAITAVYTPAITALIDGMTLHVRATSANATTTPTFTPGSPGIAAKTIVKGNNLALAIGDIAGAGFWATLRYDSTLDKWVLINPATGVSSGLTQDQADARYSGIGYMLVKDEKAINIDAGSSVVGIVTRTLNTVSANTITGASLAGNQVTLPAGTYRVQGHVPAFCTNVMRGALYNVTDAAYTLLGTSENIADASGASQAAGGTSTIKGRFTIAAPKVFEVRQYNGIAVATLGLGQASNSMGNEVYTMLEIIKES